jgi:hypothetical protein
MSTLGDEFWGDDEQIMEHIKEALEELVDKKYIEIVGIDENGEWLYKATPAGIEFYEKRLNGQE